MKFSVITPNFNGERFLEETISSIAAQKKENLDIEYIVVDGGSTDRSMEIINSHRDEIDILIVEGDSGPANAINKGFREATGDIISWLNADDIYYPDSIARVAAFFKKEPDMVFCFGRCPIIDEKGSEIRKPITKFKEMFFPISSQFIFQSINYISQPSVFFRKSFLCAQDQLLREDMVAAWDYEFFLRLWRYGAGKKIHGGSLAAFRWYESTISGQNFETQFEEELLAAIDDAGKWSPQVLLHHCVRLGIVSIYNAMAKGRSRRREKNGRP